MAQHASALKRIRQTKRRAEVNRNRRSRVATFIRKVETAIAAGDGKAAQEALRQAQPQIMRSASKGIMKRQTASRKISRLSQRIKLLSNTA